VIVLSTWWACLTPYWYSISSNNTHMVTVRTSEVGLFCNVSSWKCVWRRVVWNVTCGYSQAFKTSSGAHINNAPTLLQCAWWTNEELLYTLSWNPKGWPLYDRERSSIDFIIELEVGWAPELILSLILRTKTRGYARCRNHDFVPRGQWS